MAKMNAEKVVEMLGELCHHWREHGDQRCAGYDGCEITLAREWVLNCDRTINILSKALEPYIFGEKPDPMKGAADGTKTDLPE